MGFCPKKNTFLQLKHIQWIYLTLLSTTCVQIHQITYVIFEAISHFHNTTPLYLFSSNITFHKSSPSKCKFSDFSTAQIKVHQIPHVIFQIKSQLFFKVWIFFQFHERSFFCTSQAETLCAIGKSSTLKCKFPDLPLLALKFTKFLMSFLEPRVSFSSNFASLFNVRRHNSSVLFVLNICKLWTNGSNESAHFQTFNCLHEN